MTRRFAGTTARKYDEHPEPSRRALLAKDREIRRLQEWRHASEDTLRFIAAVIRDEGEGDPTWTLEQIRAAIGRWERHGVSDRRLWLEERCPSCHARPGLRCQTGRYGGKPSRVLHGARGWRHRSCPTCKAQPGQLCRTPTGRQAGQPHTARLNYGRRELFADEDVWQELERWGASAALVRFSGGGGSLGSIAADARGRRQEGVGSLGER